MADITMAPGGSDNKDQQQSGAPTQRTITIGKGNVNSTDNSVSTAKYSIFSFFPMAVREQFRRNGNVYFLVMGFIMYIGTYTELFDSSISPWTTLGPLAFVVCVSLMQEGVADLNRHRSDARMNSHPCVVLRRAEELSGGDRKRDKSIMDGNDVVVRMKYRNSPKTRRGSQESGASETGRMQDLPIAFETVKRRDIYAGDIVLVKNRDMIPADIILLGSSGESGAAYIETSPIDGETNLKLRSSPHLPLDVMNLSTLGSIKDGDEYNHPKFETIEQAVKRVTRFSLLGYPDGVSALRNPNDPSEPLDTDIAREAQSNTHHRNETIMTKILSIFYKKPVKEKKIINEDTDYVAALTSELPNASVNTFSGKFTIPSTDPNTPSVSIPLGAENILLRGAMLRNTEWVVGVACFTGSDTKLVRNSFRTPSKFSRLDVLMNKTVILIMYLMITSVIVLAGLANNAHSNQFDTLWYASYNLNTTQLWPYFAQDGFEAPQWRTKAPNYVQFAFTYFTLLNNFVPLSLYVTVEMITLFMMLLIGWDKSMYHKATDTPAVARSTIVTDLGQVEYVFSDKTGTLTQNVMKFKRCSVDGMIFGAPVEKTALDKRNRKGYNEEAENETEDADSLLRRQAFHPLKRLLVGSISIGGDERGKALQDKTLTFNAEMFLRIMSICHTVVVEKEIDASKINNEQGRKNKNTNDSEHSGSTPFKNIFKRNRANTGDSASAFQATPTKPVTKVEATSLQSVPAEKEEIDLVRLYMPNASDGGVEIETPVKSRANTEEYNLSEKITVKDIGKKSFDGSPVGHAYQAESPDEGALVSAASLVYGYQLIGRESDGIILACTVPSLLANEDISSGLKTGSLSAKQLASDTALPSIKFDDKNFDNGVAGAVDNKFVSGEIDSIPSIEKWSILAVNKFDSDRKRMSVVVRSPPELGSLPMLLCKGADSSMLDSNVCDGGMNIMTGSSHDNNNESPPELQGFSAIDVAVPPQVNEGDSFFNRGEDNQNHEVEDWEAAAMLEIQTHLGTFASEGLRTLVLGVRILSEKVCDDWITRYKEASNSIKDRELRLKEVAIEIETKLHIVGATAIEDKLQTGVPETIYNIGKAGIKLWVLTGDKRETAIEIGYSTKVLSPKMHVTEVPDSTMNRVRALIAMEFIKLVKTGKLLQYQSSALKQSNRSVVRFFCNFFEGIGMCRRACSRALHTLFFIFVGLFNKKRSQDGLEAISGEASKDKLREDPLIRKQKVRELSESIIRSYLESSEGVDERRRKSLVTGKTKYFDNGGGLNDLDLGTDSIPDVFSRAHNAMQTIDSHRDSGTLNQTLLRSLTIASVTSNSLYPSNDAPVVDEDTLSLQSFVPDTKQKDINEFDRKRRTILEKIFAVDRDVRKGRLAKHLNKEKRAQLKAVIYGRAPKIGKEQPDIDHEDVNVSKALVIEGAALAHLLGDPLLEEMLFAVASCCDSVIACRVSPKQKALLVKLVQNYVTPSPVTLAIGDGANDVGMIQEAQVGVGISGLEGQQAVNASDFSIAQFRFLEDLLLVHGRWNFMRMSKVVLFSFYKNATLAGLLIVFSSDALYSGTPLFDMWILSMFNFVCGFPILLLGFFDRDLEKDYIKRHSHLYASGPNNEHLSLRVTLRWVFLCIVHINVLYYLCSVSLEGGGGMTSAFRGLMNNVDSDRPGDGEGSDLKVFGTTIYSALVFTMAYKVLFESRAIINGEWPAFTCRKDAKEGFWSRVAYTWVGVTWLSIIFYFFGVYTYMLVGIQGASTFSPYVYVTYHMFNTRSITWMVVLIAPIAATACDVTGKTFSNMFYPTQTQIHIEMQARENRKKTNQEFTPNKECYEV